MGLWNRAKAAMADGFEKLGRKRKVIAGGAVGGGTAIASAATPTLPAITSPVDTASIVSAIVAFAVVIALAAIPATLGFRGFMGLVRTVAKTIGMTRRA